MTTPTPPDAVREALMKVLDAAYNKDSYGRDAVFALMHSLGVTAPLRDRIADALLTRPSDARGREVTEAMQTIARLEVSLAAAQKDLAAYRGDNKHKVLLDRFDVMRAAEVIADSNRNAPVFVAKLRAALSATQEGA